MFPAFAVVTLVVFDWQLCCRVSLLRSLSQLPARLSGIRRSGGVMGGYDWRRRLCRVSCYAPQ
ncbi:hypothetical protein ABF638_37400 [Nostoc sp. CALU 1950]